MAFGTSASYARRSPQRHLLPRPSSSIRCEIHRPVRASRC